MISKKRKLTYILSGILSSMLWISGVGLSARAEEKTVTVRIPVSCTGDYTAERFTFELEGGGSVYEQVDAGTLTLADGEEGYFAVTYSYPGTYHYTAEQKPGSDDATVYDDTVYQIDVYVTENDAGEKEVHPVMYVKGEMEKREKLDFHNSREVPVSPEEPESPKESEQPEQTETVTPVSVPEVRRTEPRTGDNSSLTLWIVVLLSASGIICTVGRTRNRQ